MIWSLLKIILFVGIIGALTFGVMQLMQMSGSLELRFFGQEYVLGPLQTLIALVLLIIALWLLQKVLALAVAFFRFLIGDETALSRYFDRNRERKGFRALRDGMMALAAGEGAEAVKNAERADKYLDEPTLTTLLKAQGAELSGDKRKAEEAYKALLDHDKGRFVGVRGLMQQKLAAGDTDTAMKLAEKAFALKPAHAEVQDTLLRLQAQQGDWSGARQTLSAKLKHGTLPRDVHKRRDAVLALSQAKDVIEDGKTIEAREAAIEANRLSPDLIPAAVAAADGYIEAGKPRYAARVLKKAWDARPHPDLAAAFARIKPDESAAGRVKRFQELTRLSPDHPESKMLMAELQLAAEDFPAARRALGDLTEGKDATARAITIMAAIERGEGADDAVTRGWLAKALTAPRGPAWTCENCNKVHASWAPVCDNCGAFDTLAWKEPEQDAAAGELGAEMLPLLTGGASAPALAAATEAAADEAQTDVTPATEPAPAEVVEEVAEVEVLGPDDPAPETGDRPEPSPSEAEVDAKKAG